MIVRWIDCSFFANISHEFKELVDDLQGSAHDFGNEWKQDSFNSRVSGIYLNDGLFLNGVIFVCYILFKLRENIDLRTEMMDEKKIIETAKTTLNTEFSYISFVNPMPSMDPKYNSPIEKSVQITASQVMPQEISFSFLSELDKKLLKYLAFLDKDNISLTLLKHLLIVSSRDKALNNLDIERTLNILIEKSFIKENYWGYSIDGPVSESLSALNSVHEKDEIIVNILNAFINLLPAEEADYFKYDVAIILKAAVIFLDTWKDQNERIKEFKVLEEKLQRNQTKSAKLIF